MMIHGPRLLAHIGNIPVEEWLPFVVPIAALWFYGGRRERRRRKEVGGIPTYSASLSPSVVADIVAAWRRHDLDDVGPEHLPLLYPPGPDGLTTAEMADVTRSDPKLVGTLLEQLERADYLFLEGEPQNAVASLTVKGYVLVDTTEDAVLTGLRATRSHTGSSS